MKIFSKQNKIEKQPVKQQLCEKKDDKPLSLGTDSKKTKSIDKKVYKLKKKVDVKTLEKKKMKDIIETVNFTENSGTSFKRNLRPRRPSTMLDDYIMTDSDEDDTKCEPVIKMTKCEAPKLSTKTTIVTGESKSQKCKLSTDESVKKNLKINKTDLKLNKDLNKDSEVKKSLSETKSKSILLKHDKELEIKNIKNTAVDKKNERSSKNKTEIVVNTKEAKTTGIGSKNAGKKVPPSKQQSTKKENTLNKKKSNLDLYNNNNNKKKRSTSSSSVTSLSSSMFSGITSQTKEELLERMAANFDAKPTFCEGAEKSANKVMSTATVESNNGSAATKNTQNNAKEKHVESSVIDKKVQSYSIEVEKKTANEVNSVNNEFSKNNQELEKVSKTENVVAVPKEENVNMTAEKVENVVMAVDKVEKTESMIVPLNKVEKVENMVFQTIAKDLFLGQQKEIKITIPEYFSGKNFQLDNRFKQDDGLSVLSEICSALPRFNEPYVSSRQLLNKMPAPGDSSFVKYVPPAISEDEKPPVQTLTQPAFESRTVKIVNLARGSSSSGANDKNDLTASWRQAFKNVKLPKNGIASSAASVGNNLIAWTKKKQNDNQIPLPKTYTDGIDGGCKNGGTKELISNSNSMKNTLQSSPVNGISEKKSESSYKQQTTCCGESKMIEMLDCKKNVLASAPNNSSYLAKTTILSSTKYDLKFEKRSSSAATATMAVPISLEKQQIRKDVVGDVSSSDDQSPEKKIFHQRRLSTTQSCSGNSSDAFSPDNETSVYAFQPDLPIASTPFRRNKPQSPAKSRTVSPNTSIAVSI